jgi:Tfp pilus assembly protein PilF
LVFLARGDVYKAIKCFDNILRLKPDYPDAHFNLGLTLASLTQYDEAIEHFKRALQLKPDWYDVYYYLGLTYSRIGKIEMAIQNLRRALQLKPRCYTIMNHLAWLLAATENANSRNPSEAVKLAQQACKLTAYKQPQLLDTLAVAYAAADRYNQAIETAQRAIDLAETANQKDLAEEIRSRLQLYKQNQPYIGPLPKVPQPID